MRKQNLFQMWPSFEIYLSMMTDSWMPWLEENRRTDRFSILLHAAWPVLHGPPDAFFRTLMPLLRPSSFPLSPRFCAEVKALSESGGARPNAVTGAFLSLPAAGHREKFYHLLTGFSLAGYEHWINSIAGARTGNECRLHFMRQLACRLSTLIGLPVFHGGACLREMELLYHVKAALCILYTRLFMNTPGYCPAVFPCFSAKEKLLDLLGGSGLEDATCSSIMALYDHLAPQQGLPTRAKSFSQAVPLPAATMPSGPAPENFSIGQLLDELNTELKEVKQGLEILSRAETTLHTKVQQEQALLIDSGTALRMLGISKSSLQRHRDSGLLPFSKIGGKIIYSDADVKKVIEEGKNKKKQTTGNKKASTT
jgi:hypothetical protein